MRNRLIVVLSIASLELTAPALADKIHPKQYAYDSGFNNYAYDLYSSREKTREFCDYVKNTPRYSNYYRQFGCIARNEP